MVQFHGEDFEIIRRLGGVSNVDIDGNNSLKIKAIGIVISTFETLPAPELSVVYGYRTSSDHIMRFE